MDTTAFEHIEYLLPRWLEGIASPAEETELLQLLDKHAQEPRVMELMEELVASGESVQINESEWQPMVDSILQYKPARKLSWLRYAAAVILFIGVAGSLLVLKPWKKQATEVAVVQPISDILPGNKKAYLTLGNGQTVTLDDVKAGERIGNAVKTADGKLVYEQADKQVVTYNTVTVPRGGMPQFVELPDHSQVWVNTESSITYATVFTGDLRQVRMTGEAYFEVAKNGKPFVVQTRTDRIEVMGTHFNINSYTDEPAVRTTLLEGKVRIGHVVLAPDEQYAGGRVVKIDAAAIQRVMAWKNGLFSYDKVDVQTLMRDLSRYYDMEVVFEGEPDKRTYEGKIGRSLTLKEVLDGLHFTDLNYRLEKGPQGNRIVMLP